jgi:hypothetical protein
VAKDDPAPGSFAARVDAIESAYEFMLAYAAQGRTDEPAGPGHIRDMLNGAVAAIDGIAAAAKAACPAAVAAAVPPLLEVLADDGRKALAMIRFALAQRAITSQMVDNLNASIHVRALLTDLFIIDESLKG